MESNVNYAIVGAFVISLIAAITLTIIWLSSGFTFQHFKIYQINSQESISGLSIDSPVEYNGVNVGTVKSIELDEKNPQLVIVLLSITSTTPITRGTTATLNTRGLTGITYISLKDKSTDLRPLLAVPGQKYPIIPTAPSFFVRLDTALTVLTKNIRAVSETFVSVFNKENQENIKKILNNLQSVTGELAANNERLGKIMENTAKASLHFTPLVQSSMNTMHVLETQTLPSAYQLIYNMDNLSRTLNEVAIEIKQNPAILVRGVDRTKLGPGETK